MLGEDADKCIGAAALVSSVGGVVASCGCGPVLWGGVRTRQWW